MINHDLYKGFLLFLIEYQNILKARVCLRRIKEIAPQNAKCHSIFLDE